MVMTLKDGQLIDLTHIYFIQAEDGPILIGCSLEPLATHAAVQECHFCALKMAQNYPGTARMIQLLREKLAVHHINRGWYAPSPDVLEYAYGPARVVDDSVPGVRPRRKGKAIGGKKLGRAEALEAYRLYYETRLEQRLIAARYAVSQSAVARVIRGESYGDLFRFRDGDGARYISLAGNELAPWYRLNTSKGGVSAWMRCPVCGHEWVSEARVKPPVCSRCMAASMLARVVVRDPG